MHINSGTGGTKAAFAASMLSLFARERENTSKAFFRFFPMTQHRRIHESAHHHQPNPLVPVLSATLMSMKFVIKHQIKKSTYLFTRLN